MCVYKASRPVHRTCFPFPHYARTPLMSRHPAREGARPPPTSDLRTSAFTSSFLVRVVASYFSSAASPPLNRMRLP
ncbi:hypothetical protein BC629DRAFT_291997 [Irpex lacteus]|nr:hypothetical protein BC629DRAFT_291997 [Irpex lacteus]